MTMTKACQKHTKELIGNFVIVKAYQCNHCNSERSKIYRENNPGKYLEYFKIYRKNNAEKIKKYRTDNRLRFREDSRGHSRAYTKRLKDPYVKNRLLKQGVSAENITTELIKIKRLFMVSKRLLKEDLKHGNTKR